MTMKPNVKKNLQAFLISTADKDVWSNVRFNYLSQMEVTLVTNR
jgi:hypothetical protein